jgi:acyl carrier protein
VSSVEQQSPLEGRETLLLRVRSALDRLLGVDPADVHPGTFLVRDLGLDSVDMLRLIDFLRHDFGIPVDSFASEPPGSTQPLSLNNDLTVDKLITKIEGNRSTSG